MSVEINFLAVVLATVASMVVGSLWYMPQVFGNRWMKLAGVSKKDMEKNSWKPILVSIATSFVLAYVLAHFIYLADAFYAGDYSFLMSALLTSLWAWFGFTALRIWTHDIFEGRAKELTLLNAVHELVTFLAMGLIIGLIGV